MSKAGRDAGLDPALGRGPFQRWLGRRTLRGRLIAGLVALLAVACAAIGLVTYVGLRHGLMSQLDEQLGAASARYSTCLEAVPPDNDHGGGIGTGQNPQPAGDDDRDTDNMPGGAQMCGQEQGGQTFSAWIDGSKVIYPTVANGHCRLTPTDLTALKTLKGATQPKTVSFAELGPYQLMASPARAGPPSSPDCRSARPRTSCRTWS